MIGYQLDDDSKSLDGKWLQVQPNINQNIYKSEENNKTQMEKVGTLGRVP